MLTMDLQKTYRIGKVARLTSLASTNCFSSWSMEVGVLQRGLRIKENIAGFSACLNWILIYARTGMEYGMQH